MSNKDLYEMFPEMVEPNSMKELFLEIFNKEFEPVAFYDERMGCLRVILEDCRSVTESITSGLDIMWKVDDEGIQTGKVVGIAIYTPKLKFDARMERKQ